MERELGHFLTTEQQLIRTKAYSDFIKEKRKDLKRFYTDLNNHQREFFFGIFRQGGHQLFTYGRLEGMSILYEEPPVLGKQKVGNTSQFKVFSMTVNTRRAIEDVLIQIDDGFTFSYENQDGDGWLQDSLETISNQLNVADTIFQV